MIIFIEYLKRYEDWICPHCLISCFSISEAKVNLGLGYYAVCVWDKDNITASIQKDGKTPHIFIKVNL